MLQQSALGDRKCFLEKEKNESSVGRGSAPPVVMPSFLRGPSWRLRLDIRAPKHEGFDEVIDIAEAIARLDRDFDLAVDRLDARVGDAEFRRAMMSARRLRTFFSPSTTCSVL